MTVPKFIIADENGDPEGITDPIQDKDPEPAKPNKTSPRVKSDPIPKMTRPVGRPSRSQIEREVSEELEAIMKMMAMGWTVIDQECGPVLNKQAKDIADSLTDILSKNPKLLQRFKDMTGFGDYGKLLFAVLPVIQAVSRHHLAAGFQKVENNGSAQTAA